MRLAIVTTGFVMATLAFAQTARVDKICAEKQIEYRDPPYHFLSCGHPVDSGITPLSSSYLPKKARPEAASADMINDLIPGSNYVNPFKDSKGRAYIKGSRDLFDRPVDMGDKMPNGDPVAHRGLPLLSQLKRIVNGMKTDANDPMRVFFNSDWSKSYDLQSAATADDSDGSCKVWAPFAADRKNIQFLKGIHQGLMCDEQFPLDLGQIKVIFQKLYEPKLNVAHTFDHVDGLDSIKTASGEKPLNVYKDLMEANIGLQKLGLLGAGEGKDAIEPGQMMDTFRVANQKGQGVTFDREHGFQRWNHPVAAMVDSTYQLLSPQDPVDYLSFADFESNGTPHFAELKALEKNLAFHLAEGTGLEDDDLKKLYSIASLTQAGYTKTESWIPLQEQVDLLLQIKRKLVRDYQIKLNTKKYLGVIGVVHHDLTLLFGDESGYASQDPDDQHLRTRSYRYTGVTSNGKMVRSLFTPTTIKLSKWCADPKHTQSGATPEEECAKLKQYGPKFDYDVFDSAVPPRHLSVWDVAEDNLAMSYFKNEIIAKHCKLLDPAVRFAERFMDGFNAQTSTNVLNKKDPGFDSWVADFVEGSSMLDEKWIKANLCAGGVVGLSDFVADPRVKAAMPGLCL